MQKMRVAENNSSPIHIIPTREACTRRGGAANRTSFPRGGKFTCGIIKCGLMLGILAACSGQARADDNVTRNPVAEGQAEGAPAARGFGGA